MLDEEGRPLGVCAGIEGIESALKPREMDWFGRGSSKVAPLGVAP